MTARIAEFESERPCLDGPLITNFESTLILGTLAMPFFVEKATIADIPRIVAIADAARLNEEAPQPGGFLVSDLTERDYKQFERYARDPSRGVCFQVARRSMNEDCIAFLLGYDERYVQSQSKKRSGWPSGGSEAALLELLAPLRYRLINRRTRFFIIKQIAVEYACSGRSAARDLYAHLFKEIEADSFFAAIVAKPENGRSERFHRLQGFSPIMQSRSFSKRLEESETREYINRVWFRPGRPIVIDYRLEASGDVESKAPAPLPTSLDDEAKVALRANYELAQRLYLHEDNLNWSKISRSITVFAGLVSAVYLLSVKKTNLPLDIVVIILGAALLIFLSATLESGLFFMHSYKQAIRILESRMKLLYPDLLPLIWRVPSRSATVRILSYAIYPLLVVWLGLCVWLSVFFER
jgi:hypothetical protein